MKRIAAALAVLTIASLFVLRDECPCPAEPVPAAEPARRTDEVDVPAPHPLRPVETAARVSRSRRDLFAYEERPVLVAARPAAVIAPVTAAPVIEAPIPTPTPAPPHFPYRYIGRFGPAHDPIAAFVGNDRIVTVRPGERIDEQFVLRAIGIESVEIEARGWERRIPIGLSAPV